MTANGKRAVVFCNGVRQRMIDESGGLDALSPIFDVFIDVSAFAKPWEYEQSYEDRVTPETTVSLRTPEEAHSYFAAERFDYVLVVGLEWSKARAELVASIGATARAWGILFVRGDLRDLFRGRQYDDRWFNLPRRALRRKRAHLPKGIPPATHYFSNETKGFEFPEVVPGVTHTVPVNHIDWHYLARAEPAEGPPALVFLDQAVTFTFADAPNNLHAERFFDAELQAAHLDLVNDYLRRLRDQTGLPVVVCLHPNWPSSAPSPYDATFTSVRKQTVNWLMNCRLAVTHTSMATGFCHLLNVPTVLLDLPRNLMPDEVYFDLRKKAKAERLPVHRWPAAHLPTERVPPANNARIRNFLAPDAAGSSLREVLEVILHT
ncbi:hypothetical protein N8I71_15105 [Roseibacterium sp. SDUM158016]|uniref:hypothetical protein n=1 Tax=Roseicyclus sediminis TaxID=2980997 RepID=UPI0021D16FEA|nr:hypothetical protein [Roseibacterium sp. SDUM158016]MCU4654172.1 hypothetical protein [Roseibacterium sp. SDUM158016]